MAWKRCLIHLTLLILPLATWCICSYPTAAEEFELPREEGESVIGWNFYTRAQAGDTLLDIARLFDLGHDQIIAANPAVNRWIPSPGTRVLIPARYILPRESREGIIVNLAELRLYYYPKHGQTVHTFPVSIGDMDWRTPLGETTIRSKERNPDWIPPESIREEHLLEGEVLPSVVPGGDPENPLGALALRLARPGYLIHGTDERRAFGIGMRVSHGCIRMYPEDIDTLFREVPVGTKVRIVDDPVKVGWDKGVLYMSVHRALETEEQDAHEPLTVDTVLDRLVAVLEDTDQFDSRAIKQAFLVGDGAPVPVAVRPAVFGSDTNEQYEEFLLR